MSSDLGNIRSAQSASGGCGCTGGGRRRHRTRHRHVGGVYAPSTDGHAAQLPYDTASVAPGTAVGVNGTFSGSGGNVGPSPFPYKGGSRSRSRTRTRRRRSHRGGAGIIDDAIVAGTAVTLAKYFSKKSGGRRALPRRVTKKSFV